MLLDVLLSLTVWYNEYGVNINRKFLCPDDLLLKKHKYKTCRLFVFSTRRRGITTVPHLVAYHFIASQRRISPTTVRRRLHKAGLYARRQVVCVPLNRRQKRSHLCCARAHFSYVMQQSAAVFFTDDSRFTLARNTSRLLI